MSRKFTVQRIDLAEANAFVAEHHRHHKPVVGHLFSLGAVVKDGKVDGEQSFLICGIAIVGRPVARMRDDGVTAEVTRLCTDGTKDACSFLYGAAARAAFALGFQLRDAFADLSRALCRPEGPSLAVQQHDPSWEAWKNLCDIFGTHA